MNIKRWKEMRTYTKRRRIIYLWIKVLHPKNIDYAGIKTKNKEQKTIITESEKNTLKLLIEYGDLKEKQTKDETLCCCGAITPEEHLGICDYCWENINKFNL